MYGVVCGYANGVNIWVEIRDSYLTHPILVNQRSNAVHFSLGNNGLSLDVVNAINSRSRKRLIIKQQKLRAEKMDCRAMLIESPYCGSCA